jgi:prepilin-type N-terminal cleavage/methylation domain-containing protein
MKLKGFTLTEIIVALAISSLVLLSGLSLYYLTFKGSINFQRNSNNKLIQLELYNRLIIDIEDCELVTANTNKLNFIYTKHTVSYLFRESYVVINAENICDTLKAQINDLTLKMDNKVVSTGLVNEVIISTENYNKNNIVLHKKYAAVTYLPK